MARQSSAFWMAAGFALVLLVGLLASRTEPEPLVFYLIPILLTARFASRRAGIVLSISSAIVWLAAEMAKSPSYSHPVVPYWNAVTRLAVFLLVTYVLSAMLAAKKRQEELMQFIVHDLRSPLTNILSGLQTLRNASNGELDEIQQEVLDMAMVGAKRMQGLINALLDVPRLESGKLPLYVIEVQPELLAELALEQVSLWAQRNSVSLEVQLDTGGLTVKADPSLTERVLVNLLSNALKYAPPCSVVTLHVAPFDAQRLAFSITDQGPGIPSEWAHKVFEPFAQVKGRQVRTAVGSGIGLTFCKRAVEAQEGRIWLESEVGRGTTVTFSLPIAGRL